MTRPPHKPHPHRRLCRREKEAMFHQYERLALSLAYKTALRHGLPLYELADEARSLLGRIIAGWDRPSDIYFYKADKATPCTRIYQSIHWGLTDYCTRHNPLTTYKSRRGMVPFSKLEEEAVFNPPAPEDRMQKLLSDLSEEALLLVQTILTAPGDLAKDVSTATRGRGRRAVWGHMRTKYHWDDNLLQSVWAEVQECLV